MFILLLSFSRSLASMAEVSDIQNVYQPYLTRPNPIDSNPNEYNQGLHYHSLMVSLDRCNGTFNTYDDLSGEIVVQNFTSLHYL